MGKGSFGPGPSWSQSKLKAGWLEMRALMGMCTVLAVAAIVVTTLYYPFEGLGSFELSSSHCNCEAQLQWSIQLEHEKQEHLRQMLTTIGLSTSRAEQQQAISRPSNCCTKSEFPPDPRSTGKPHILREWETPAVVEGKEWEKLHEASYGVPRKFVPLGSAAFLFVQFGAYRGGRNSFAVVGLGPKGLHVHGNPEFQCSWESSDASITIPGNATKYLPDWGYGKQYTVVVVNCTFPSDVGADGSGGRLAMVATHGSWDSTGLEDVAFEALTEQPGEVDGAAFQPPYRYEYLYCGSPLFGSISPQRMREWISYHAMLFGPRSHFILYDAGGIHDEVRRILEPWVKLGRVTVMNIRQQMRYDTYYYNQFLVVNDCLFRAKALANWTFFFDVDEFLHVPWYMTFDAVMTELRTLGRRATQVVFAQKPISHNHCAGNVSSSSDGNMSSLWAMEKLTYRRTQITETNGFMDKKFAIQARYALSTGVHRSEDLMYSEQGLKLENATLYEDWRLHYYHYHNTINHRQEVCEQFVDPSIRNATRLDNVVHEFDDTMVPLAAQVRDFELRTVGELPTII
ncbi:galactan beta-1,4-galactosyltransferase [Marchantia polymorpha subsp. ruderalis]|uniref:Glycosyltransferase family 92 protein n=2 Tax=Marchantia polymorpha TaxID=3197 RepID=A0A176W3V5_MARPO|nr:hypothetical protein AXG93_4363s1040 [Marchantia polymorpha subsp. ruderalis]PTQ40087.1 hypothetical protein MARPO_0042s0120 [Marchantia polymorpha]BBN02391.1 hypothetical protein Mp_2g14970 [Marchantia polymorpha subsp. ruderalis]|eukprot:PTQ40087.1 hypothetical protein MARPO_0042s0120 [Marchantia polymorpha]